MPLRSPGRAGPRAPARGDLPRERRQPVLRAAARRRRAHTGAQRRPSDRMATDSGVPRSVAAALLGGARRAHAPTRAGCWTRARSRATRSSRSSAYEIAGLDPADRDGRAGRAARPAAAAHRPPCRGASRSATRSCAAPSTSPPAAAGGWSRTPARPRRWRSAARLPRPRAHHVEQSAGRGRPGGDRAAARGRRGDRAARPRGRRALVRGRAAAAARGRRRATRARGRWSRLAHGRVRSTGETSERCALVARARLLEATRACAAPGDDSAPARRHARVRSTAARAAASTSSAATSRPTGGSTPRSTRCRTATRTTALTVLFARIAGAFFTLDVAEGCALGEEALAVADASATRC